MAPRSSCSFTEHGEKPKLFNCTAIELQGRSFDIFLVQLKVNKNFLSPRELYVTGFMVMTVLLVGMFLCASFVFLAHLLAVLSPCVAGTAESVDLYPDTD